MQRTTLRVAADRRDVRPFRYTSVKDLLGHSIWRGTYGILAAVLASLVTRGFMDETDWNAIGLAALIGLVLGATIGPFVADVLLSFFI